VSHWGESGIRDAIGVGSVVLDVAACTAFGRAPEGPLWEPEEPLAPEEPGAPEPNPKPNSREGVAEANICPLCFAAGTPVHTEHGDVPIEQIKVGDEVIARDQRTGKSELEPVTDLIPKHQGTLVELRIEGEPNVLRPSVAHPFWTRFNDSDSGHWITAANLRPGELVETIDGNWRKIESVTHDSGEEPVYNFTVANDHDYFVGETGFLVHNANCNCQRHHITPKYLGGPEDGPLSTIPTPYHQLITATFRTVATRYGFPYGSGQFPDPDTLQAIKDEVYSQFPCVADEEFF
jgi:hypothetical protein